MNAQKIALFGGSFNPPHRGHADVIEFLCQDPEHQEVWLVPTFQHAFGKSLLDFDTRHKLCVLMLNDLGETAAKAKVVDIEKRLAGESRSRESRTIDTVQALMKENPQAHFTLVLGEDLRADLPRWKDIQKLKTLVDFRFIPRPFRTDISSTELRESLASGSNIERWLTQGVARYVKEHGLWKNPIRR